MWCCCPGYQCSTATKLPPVKCYRLGVECTLEMRSACKQNVFSQELCALFSLKPISHSLALCGCCFPRLSVRVPTCCRVFSKSGRFVVGAILRWDFFFSLFLLFCLPAHFTHYYRRLGCAVRCGNIFHIVCIILRFLFPSNFTFFSASFHFPCSFYFSVGLVLTNLPSIVR